MKANNSAKSSAKTPAPSENPVFSQKPPAPSENPPFSQKPPAPETAAKTPTPSENPVFSQNRPQIAPQIATVLQNLPAQPGVYMYYEGSALLYVGKAKSLKNRIRSYFAFRPELRPSPRVSERIALMLARASELKFIQTPTELDALVLENSLIKQLRPKFNILLRDDKTYPYICIDGAAPYPRPQLVRRIVRAKNLRYFGPYASGGKALLEALYELFRLRQKGSCKKICLFAQLGRCLAPCERDVAAAYAAELKAAVAALKNPKKLLAPLQEKMFQAAAAERFEQAAKLRDMCAHIEKITAASASLDLARQVSFDAVAAAAHEGRLAAVRAVVMAGRVVSVISQSLRGADEQEFLRAFLLAQYGQLAPARVYLDRDLADAPLLEEAILAQSGCRCQLARPRAKDVRALCESLGVMALKSLQTAALAAEPAGATGAQALAERLGISGEIERIEVFDNSMLQGSARVGAMVVYDAEAGRWDKSGYRKYLLNGSSDYEQMREVLSRRIARFGENPPPALWVIDGGKALLNLARSLLAKSGANVEVIAISKEKRQGSAHRAKGAAADVLYASERVWRLGANDAALQFAQMLRDEAHRFAIATHRALKRRRDLGESELARAGLSAGAISKLLRYFGSFEAVNAAGYEQLRAAAGKIAADKLLAHRQQQ